MSNHHTVIQNAIAAVQKKGLTVTVARVKQYLSQPVPMGVLMPAVHSMRHQTQEPVDLEAIEAPQAPTMTPEMMLEEIRQLKERVTQIEAELTELKPSRG